MKINALIIGFFLLVNLIALGIMFADKAKARKKDSERISEGMLFFLATAFGSIGVLAGMFLFHHKTRKWYFRLGIPLLIAQNCSLLWIANEFFSSGILK